MLRSADTDADVSGQLLLCVVAHHDAVLGGEGFFHGLGIPPAGHLGKRSKQGQPASTNRGKRVAINRQRSRHERRHLVFQRTLGSLSPNRGSEGVRNDVRCLEVGEGGLAGAGGTPG